MTTTIIVTAVITSLLLGVFRLAWCEAKRRVRTRYRKTRRAVSNRVGTQSRKVYRREREAELGYHTTTGRSPWSGVTVDEHRQHLIDSLRRAA